MKVSISQVLAAAYPAANTALAAQNLLEKGPELARISKEMPVISVIGQDNVMRVIEGTDDCHLTEFLSDCGVGSPGKQSLAEKLKKCLFGRADQAPECVD
jgi:hypothetical protein